MKISNIKIRYKILACFVLLGAIVVGVIWFATSKMKAIDNIYSQMIARRHSPAGLYPFPRIHLQFQWADLAARCRGQLHQQKEDYRGYRSQPKGHRKFHADQEARAEIYT
jgi:hypothetical protein